MELSHQPNPVLLAGMESQRQATRQVDKGS